MMAVPRMKMAIKAEKENDSAPQHETRIDENSRVSIINSTQRRTAYRIVGVWFVREQVSNISRN